MYRSAWLYGGASGHVGPHIRAGAGVRAQLDSGSQSHDINFCLQRLVETAMLAAVSGLAYALASTMHLEGYLGYFLPLPVILSALRSGPAAGRKTMTATFFLVLSAHVFPSLRERDWPFSTCC